MRFRPSDTKIVEGDLTPMIDMTFQLIAFFMVLINFTETEKDERVVLPTSEIAKPGPAVPDAIYLNLTLDGDVIYGGQVIPINNLRPYLIHEGDLLDQNEKTRADATIIIRAHAEAPSGHVQRLMQVCQETQFQTFRLRVEEQTEPSFLDPQIRQGS